jgi:hypothetical protein
LEKSLGHKEAQRAQKSSIPFATKNTKLLSAKVSLPRAYGRIDAFLRRGIFVFFVAEKDLVFLRLLCLFAAIQEISLRFGRFFAAIRGSFFSHDS